MANNPTCGANAHITYGSNGSCGCACDTNYTGDGYTCRRLQCSDGGYYTSSQNSGCNSSGYKVTGSQKVTYAGLECWTAGTSTACSCSDGGYYTSSQNSGCDSSGYKKTGSTTKSYGGKTCWTAATTEACACSDGGYYTSSQNSGCNSSGYKVTGSQSVNYAGKTCWTAGTSTACDCSDGGYYTSSQNSGCDSSGYKKTGSQKVTYGGKDCYTAGTSTACACSDGGYESSCSTVECTYAGGGSSDVTTAVSCSSKTYAGKTCYQKSSSTCQCSDIGHLNSCSATSCVGCHNTVTYNGKQCYGTHSIPGTCSSGTYGKTCSGNWTRVLKGNDSCGVAACFDCECQLTCGSGKKLNETTCVCEDVDACTSGCAYGTYATLDCCNKHKESKTCVKGKSGCFKPVVTSPDRATFHCKDGTCSVAFEIYSAGGYAYCTGTYGKYFWICEAASSSDTKYGYLRQTWAGGCVAGSGFNYTNKILSGGYSSSSQGSNGSRCTVENASPSTSYHTVDYFYTEASHPENW